MQKRSMGLRHEVAGAAGLDELEQIDRLTAEQYLGD